MSIKKDFVIAAWTVNNNSLFTKNSSPKKRWGPGITGKMDSIVIN